MKLKFASVKKSEYCCYDPRNGNGTDINTKVCSSMTKRPTDGEHPLHGNNSKCINGRCTCKHVNKVENTPCCYWSWFKYAMKRGVASPPTSKSARPKPIRKNVEHFRRLRLRKIQMIRISSFPTWLRYSFQPNCDSTRRKNLLLRKIIITATMMNHTKMVSGSVFCSKWS